MRVLALRTMGRVLFISALLGAASTAASAHPFDTYGFTSRNIAMGGAATASSTDFDAAYYNPAASTRTRGLVAGAGLLVADDFLSVSGRDADVRTHVLFEVGLAASLPFGELLKDRIFATVAIALPHVGLYDVNQPDDEAIAFPFWDGRNRRVVLTTTLAGRITDWLSIGIGTTMLPDVTGTVRVDLSGDAGRNSTRVKVQYNFGAVAGVLFDPLPWLSFGATFRQGHETTIDLPVAVDVLSDVPPVQARVVSPAFALPHQVALGVQVRPLEHLTLVADVTWAQFSRFHYSSPDVTLIDADGEVTQESRAATQSFRDTWTPRVGVEWRALPWLLVRGGYAYIFSPVPRQTGMTNLLDADRSVISAGIGFDLPGDWLGGVVRRMAIDLHGQVTILRERTFAKEQFLPENPGFPRISVSGGTFSVGLSGRVWF